MLGFGLFHVGGWLWRIFGAGRFIVPLTSAIFAVIIVLCGAVVGARRIAHPTSLCLLFCAVIAFEASAPSTYGWSVFAISMSGFYNRLSVASIGVLFLQSFVRPASRGRVVEAIVAAALLDVLLLTKISAVPLGLATIVAGTLFAARRALAPPADWRHVTTVILLFAIMAAVDFLAMGIQPGAVIAEYREAADARKMLAWTDGLARLLHSWGVFVTVVLFAIIGIARVRAGAARIGPISILIVTYVFVQLTLNVTNTQPATIYLAPFCAIVFLLAIKIPMLTANRRPSRRREARQRTSERKSSQS